VKDFMSVGIDLVNLCAMLLRRVIWNISFNKELFIHRVPYTMYDVSRFQGWQDPTSHNVYILRIFEFAYR
jgi:hypothetical protein